MPVTPNPTTCAVRRSQQEIVFSHFGPLDELKYSPPYWRPGSLIREAVGLLRVPDTVTVDLLRQSMLTGTTSIIEQVTWPAGSYSAFLDAVEMEPLERDEQLVIYLSDLGGGAAEDLSLTVTWVQ